MHASIDDVMKTYLSFDKPHPDALKVTSTIIQWRARRVQNGADDLKELANLYWDYACDLDKNLEPDWRCDFHRHGLDEPSGGRFAIQDFPIPGFVGKTSSTTRFPAGLQLRSFSVYEDASPDTAARDEKPKLVARMDIIEHVNRFLWEVFDVEVKPEFRRQGVGTNLYNSVERFIGFKIISPSGWLTEDALKFWQNRMPGFLDHFRPSPVCTELFVSPKQLLFSKRIMEWKLLSIVEREPGRLVS